MNSPTRAEIKSAMMDLVAGRLTREEVSTWASRWYFDESSSIEGTATLEALEKLSGADLLVEPNAYLYTEPDFHAWLDEFVHREQR